MPTSTARQISDVLLLVQRLKPHRILDVGVGTGKYGMLVREYLDVWEGRVQIAEWQTQIYGMEIFEAYRTQAWNFYDEVFIGDAQVLIKEFASIDLITILDVIEHLPKSEGSRFVQECLRKAKWVLITTPTEFHEQYECAENRNEHEKHLSHWSRGDFRNLAPYYAHAKKRGYQIILLSKTDKTLPSLDVVIGKNIAGIVELDPYQVYRALPSFLRKPARLIWNVIGNFRT